MAHGIVAIMEINVRLEQPGLDLVVIRQPRGQLLGNLGLGRTIEFGAVTGGEDGGFLDRAAER